MSTSLKRALFWSPRILCILFAAFLGVFSLDVFGEGLGVWQTILALVIHLVPVYIVVIVLVLAWRWEWIGAVPFGALAVFYVIWAWGRFDWSAYAVISGPLLLVGILFLLNWKYRVQIRG